MTGQYLKTINSVGVLDTYRKNDEFSVWSVICSDAFKLFRKNFNTEIIRTKTNKITRKVNLYYEKTTIKLRPHNCNGNARLKRQHETHAGDRWVNVRTRNQTA